ncbi:MAG: twin-arginine translocase TatA/TatE family subunit [Desulfobacterales bacterium]|nr:twin-arginine translocase TatA/TatE family subunit [Desulfobacterales bacterium]
MFGLGMPEILLILAIALIVIGPKKLPELAKTLGRAMGEFKRSAQDFKDSLDVDTTLTDVTPKVKAELKEVIEESTTDPTAKAEVETKPGETAEKTSPIKTEEDNSTPTAPEEKTTTDPSPETSPRETDSQTPKGE